MRLLPGGSGRAGPLRPRRGNRIWLVTSIVTVIALTGVAVRWAAAGCDRVGAGAFPAGTGASGMGGRTGMVMTGRPRGTAGWGGAGRLAGQPGQPGPGTGPAATAAVPGRAVFYDPGRAAGSCALGPFPAHGWYASLPPAGYAGGTACGSYLTVSGPAGIATAEVVDLCAQCAAGTIDLSRAAFGHIANPRAGTVPVRYWPSRNPALPGPLAMRIAVAGGAVPLAVQVLNHGNRLAAVAVQVTRADPWADDPWAGDAWAGDAWAGGSWVRLVPERDGYWAWPGGQAAGPVPGRSSVRVTDVLGHQAVLPGVPLAAGGPRNPLILRSRVWMYRSGGTRRAGPARAARASAARTPAAACRRS